MRVDFYLLSRDPAPVATAMLAGKVLGAGERLLVVADDLEQLEAISQGLWDAGEGSFLANGIAGDDHDARQPILLSDELDPVNGARFLLIADGIWRNPGDAFDRVLYLFDNATIDEARGTWRALQSQDGIEKRFWKQQGNSWVEGP